MKRFALILAAITITAGTIYIYVRSPIGTKPAQAARSNIAPAPVSVAQAGRADVPILRRAIGFAEPVATVAIKSRIDGVIADLHVKEGQEVQAGDLLFTLDDRELKAQIARDEAGVERDKATLAQKRAELTRQQSLVDKGAGTKQALDLAIADAGVAAAVLKSDQAALSLDRIRLTYASIIAPISGRLGAITATPGNAVRANDATSSLLTITELTPIRVSFPMPERELSLLHAASAEGNSAAVRVFASATKQALGTGELSFIDSAVDIPSGTINAKAVFANDHHLLWPGQYVDVEITLGTSKDAITVPSVAIQEGQSGPFLYVVGADNKVEARPITVVSNENGLAAISAGLAQGDRVVTEGQSRLEPGASVRVTLDDKPPSHTAQAQR